MSYEERLSLLFTQMSEERNNWKMTSVGVGLRSLAVSKRETQYSLKHPIADVHLMRDNRLQPVLTMDLYNQGWVEYLLWSL